MKVLNNVDKKAQDTGKSFGEMISTVAKVGAAIGTMAVAAGGALFALAKNTSDAASEIKDMSERTGLNTDRLQELKFATKQVGVEFDSLTMATKGLTNYLADAAAGGEKQSDAFKRLGVDIKNADGSLRKMDEVFPEVINRLADMGDVTDRNALANDIFGKSANELVPLLNQGSSGIKEMSRQAHDLGIVMSKDAIESGDKFGDSLDALKAAAGGVLNQVGSYLIPVFQKLSDYLISNMPKIKEIVKNVFEGIGKAAEIARRVFDALLPVIVGVTAAVVAFKTATIAAMVIQGLARAISTASAALALLAEGYKIAQVAAVAFNLTLSVNPIMMVVTAIGALVTAFMYFSSKIKKEIEEIAAKMVKQYETERDAAIKTLEETTELRLSKLREQMSAEQSAYEDRLTNIQNEYNEAVKASESKERVLKDALNKRKSDADKEYNDNIKRIQEEYGVFESKAKSKTQIVQDEAEEQKRVVDEVLKLSEDAAKAEGVAFTNTYNAILDKAKQIHDEKIMMYEEEYLKSVSLINQDLAETVKALQNEIKEIENKTSEEDRLAKEQRDRERILELQAKVDSAKDDEERKIANQSLSEEINRQNREKELQNRQIQIDSLNEQIRAATEKANEEKAAALQVLQAKISEQQVEIQKDTDYKISEIQRERIEKETAENKKYEAAKATFDKEEKALSDWSEKYKAALQKDLEAKQKNERDKLKAVTDGIAQQEKAIRDAAEKERKRIEEDAQKKIDNAKKEAEKKVMQDEGKNIPTSVSPAGTEYIPIIPIGFAEGTKSAPPGLAIVGEKGPELVNFKGGETVTPNNQLGGITVNVYNPLVLDNGMADILGASLVNRLRALGVG